jgi:hypothetical protein
MPYVGGGIFVVLIGLAIWVVSNPEKAERIAGWIASLVSKVWRKADRAAVAWRVQGDINTARAELLGSIPEGILERDIKIRWTSGEQAEALLKDGEVLVCMQRSDHHERNVANAIMAFLPKTMLPQARRYLDADRMHAADLILAKGMLTKDGKRPGALNVFFRDHLDPAREKSSDLRKMIDELDAVDLHGWLTRVLLAEYLGLGEALYPSEPDLEALREAERLARWLYGLAKREPGEESLSLTFVGRYFRVAIIFVGIKSTLEERGTKPYRKKAKTHIYRQRFNSVYLMARDDKMKAVESLAVDLESDGLVAGVEVFEYPLRHDFLARYGLDRSSAVLACVRRKRGADEAGVELDEDLDAIEADDLPEEQFDGTRAPPEQTVLAVEGEDPRHSGESHESELGASR